MEWEYWEYQGYPIRSKWVSLDEHKKDFKPYDRVIGVCFDFEGKVLVIREPEVNHWGLPGGTPEGDETYEETFVREVDEEATVSLKNIHLLGAFRHQMKNNPLKRGYEDVYHVVFFAEIDEVKEHTIDPAKGFKMERKFIKQEEFNDYVKWQEKSKIMFDDALRLLSSLRK